MHASALVELGPVGSDRHGLLRRIDQRSDGQPTLRRHPVAIACAAGAVGLLVTAEVAPVFRATGLTPGPVGRVIGPVTFFFSARLAEVSAQVPDVATYHILWTAMLVVMAVSFVVPRSRLLAAIGLGLGCGLGLTLLSLRYSAAASAEMLARDLVAAIDGTPANANFNFHATAQPGFYCAVAAVVLAYVTVAWNGRSRQGEPSPRPQGAETGPMIEVTAS
jgi:hypothetical protein